MTKGKLAKALGTVSLLFAGTYAPAFLVVSLLKAPFFEAVPAIILISLTAAILMICVLSRGSEGLAGFGFRLSRYRYVAAAIAVGVPLAWAATSLVSRLSSGPPMPERSLRPWMMIVYFEVGAGDAWIEDADSRSEKTPVVLSAGSFAAKPSRWKRTRGQCRGYTEGVEERARFLLDCATWMK